MLNLNIKNKKLLLVVLLILTVALVAIVSDNSQMRAFEVENSSTDPTDTVQEKRSSPDERVTITTSTVASFISKDIASTNQLEAAKPATLTISFGSTALILGLAFLLLAIFFARLVLRSQDEASIKAEDAAHDERDLTQHLQLYANHEIVTAAQELNKLANKIQHLVNSINKLAIVLNQSALVTKQYVNLTDTKAQKSKKTQVAAAVYQTPTAVQELADGISLNTHEADTEAFGGQHSLVQTMSSVRKISDEIKTSAESIEKLDADVEQIGSEVNFARDTSEQTNLLTLNIAIKAFRAGEQGRGFAAVANEIRMLTTRTQQSTNEIRQVIDTLQQGFIVMHRNGEQSPHTVAQADKASESFQTNTKSVGTITHASSQTTAVAEQQTTVASNIICSIYDAAQLADQAVSISEILSKSNLKLSTLEQRLITLVRLFNT